MKRPAGKGVRGQRGPAAERGPVVATTNGTPQTDQAVCESGAARPTDAASDVAAPAPVAVNSFGVLAIHVAWVFVGPLFLVLLVLNILQGGAGWGTAVDVAFFGVVAGIVLCRWLDQRSGQGTTSTGDPSTWADFRRYVQLFVTLAVGVWIVANVLGNYVLGANAGP